MKRVELFHIGPQKAGTTWVYRCLREHPGVACAPRDSVHYFDMFYGRGRDWYASHWRHADDGQKLFDATPSYIRSPWAPQRIAHENPEARIVLCLRDPIERAFSHFWHEKKKRRFEFRFEEVLENYDLFSSWIEPGFYAEHIERYLEHFPREQILCQRFEHLGENPGGFLDELLGFLGVEGAFRPSVLRRRINAAGPRRDPWNRGLHAGGQVLQRLGLPAPRMAWLTGKAEHSRGIVPELRSELAALCEPEIRRVEALLGLELSAWRRPTEHAA
jgi:hypothetical protein